MTIKKSRKSSASVGDSFVNFLAKLGSNTQNLQASSTYSLSPFISRLRTTLEAAYRSSWLIGQVVDTVAEDMTREGITLNSHLSPDDTKRLQASLTDFKIFYELCNAIKWARLYGGAIAVMLTKGADYSKPLNLETIGKDSFKGLAVFDRWMVDPSFGELITEVGIDMGKPKYYRILPGMPALSGQKIHYTRVLRFDGIELPYYQKYMENLWGLSVVERMYDRLVAFDSGTQGASQLLLKAHLRTIQVEGFREALAMGGATESAVVKQFDYIRYLQSSEGLTVLDVKDKFEVHPYSFAGISDVLLQFGEQISGATGIPLVRLFGQSPAGLSSTGESDLRNYYDHINKLQEAQMRPPFIKLLEVICRSILGKPLPEDFEFDFNSLWQMSDTEKAQIAQTDAATISAAYSSGIITKKMALKELAQQSRITGRFTNITNEDIESAQEDNPGFMGEQPPFAENNPPEGDQESGKTLEELKADLDNIDIEQDDFAVLKHKLEEIDLDKEMPLKMKATDGKVKRFVKDSFGKILKPLVAFALIYKWIKGEKKTTQEKVDQLLKPNYPQYDFKDKATRKVVLDSIKKELADIRTSFTDKQIHAPKGGISIKGKEFKGGEFIPSEGGYAEEYKKMQKEGKAGSSEESKENQSKTNKEENKTGISTESPEFKAWFKGSKVVNENGDPLVVYHGTSKEFSEFSKEKIGSNLDTGDWGKGFYFGDKPKAEEYGKRSANPEAWKTKPFYIDIKNPLVLSGPRKEEILTPDHPWVSVLKKMFGKEIIDRAIEDELDIPSLIRGEIGSDKFAETLKENGYDGVIRKYKEGSYEIIPFDPEQIKSAESKKSKEEKPKKEKKPAINYPEPKRSKMEASFIGTKRLPPTKVLNKKGEEVEKPGALVMADGSPLPAHVSHIPIPPAWQHVRINPDPKGEALIAGTDQRGRRQVKYSKAHDERVAVIKFKKATALDNNIEKVVNNIESHYGKENNEEALCLRFIEQTGARADTGKNVGAVKTYGASTLENRHIKVNDDKSVTIEFIGKHGKLNTYKVTEPKLVKMFKERAARPDKNQKVFETNYGKLKSFSMKVANVTPKVFRTRVGTNTAKAAVKTLAPNPPPPKTEKEYMKYVLAVAEKASQQLCNTRKVCLEKYINPAIFSNWKKIVGMEVKR